MLQSEKRNRNQRRSNGSTINNFLITIPRCDLPKKFVFDGLINFCERLAVAKEKHTLTYLDSCCKNSSIKINSIRETNQNESLFGSQSRFQATTSTNALNIQYSNETLNQHDIQDIINGTTSNRTDIQLYKRLRISHNDPNESIDSSQSSISTQLSNTKFNKQTKNISESQNSFLNDSIFENNSNSEWIHCNSHIHIYAELIVDFYKCKRIIKWCTNGMNANVETCKTPKNAIIYVTKEDEKPLLKNINNEEVAFHKKMMDWIKANPEYNFFDPFICSRPQFYKLIILAHSNYYKNNPIQFTPCRGLKISNLDCNNNQIKTKVQKWFNECITSWRLKFPALYLWGLSNTGKTTIIFDWLLANQVTENQIYRPARNCQFAWQDFTPSQHLVVVMDEFDINQFDIEEWKNIVEGRYTSIRVKGKSSRTIALRCPIIMISNHQPPTDKSEIINRLRIIKTEHLNDRRFF